jgi:DNA repair protein RadC
MPRIKDLPPDERPREKLLKYGADKLSDAELLTILISSGTKEKSALELGEDLLKKYGSFRGIAGRSIKEIMQIKGIKEAKAINIAASFEIARRIVKEVMGDERS